MAAPRCSATLAGMRNPTPLPPALEAAPFSVHQADAHGIPRGRLRARDLTATFRAVRVPLALLREASPERKFWILCQAYRAKLPKGWFFSGATAARILGVPVPRRLEVLEVHVSAPTPKLRPRGRHVRGHCAPGAATRNFNGHEVREPAELWCELATVLTLDELIQAGDRIISDQPVRLASRERLEQVVRAHGGRRGARLLREALPQLRENVWSPKETWVRLVLLRAGLPEPARNRDIYDARGKRVAIGDLVYDEYMTLVEYEGERWHADAQSIIDVDRFNTLSRLGWTIVRIRRHHTAEDVERMVRAALVANGWRG
ncbi:hypothetical protein GCM10022288_20650 [Gryllotalpicola kribbensis]|uniref:DUF559 domain-containing protein n=2 Tax=Gryllotalpicola kribbensis TaxID=993084 RepID=A0ABP8AUF6_9MICO